MYFSTNQKKNATRNIVNTEIDNNDGIIFINKYEAIKNKKNSIWNIAPLVNLLNFKDKKAPTRKLKKMGTTNFRDEINKYCGDKLFKYQPIPSVE